MGMATPALPRSAARKTPTIPGARRAADTSMERMRACACGERSMAACRQPGTRKSSTNSPAPVMSRGSSRRRTLPACSAILFSPRLAALLACGSSAASQLEQHEPKPSPSLCPLPRSGGEGYSHPSPSERERVRVRVAVCWRMTRLAFALGGETRAPVEGARDQRTEREGDEDGPDHQQGDGDRPCDEDRVAPRRHGQGLAEGKLHHGREDEA